MEPDPHEDPPPRFIVAGTGRSGTKWCATALRVAGLLCGHEQVFTTAQLVRNDPPRWRQFAGDSSLAATPLLHRYPQMTRILVVRHPYDFAQSWLFNGSFLANGAPADLTRFVGRRFPEVLSAANDTEATLLYWCVWNETALAHVNEVLPLEQLDLPTLLAATKHRHRWPLYPFSGVKVNYSGAGRLAPSSLRNVPSDTLDRTVALANTLGYSL